MKDNPKMLYCKNLQAEGAGTLRLKNEDTVLLRKVSSTRTVCMYSTLIRSRNHPCSTSSGTFWEVGFDNR
jgi:hypothetical protein